MRRIIPGLSGLLLVIALSSPVLGRGFGGVRPPNTSPQERASQYSFSLYNRKNSNNNSSPQPRPAPTLPNPLPITEEIKKEPFYESYQKACEKEYISDDPNLDSWKNPKKTEKDKGGDCEDISFFLYSLLKKDGIESRVVMGYMYGDYQHGHTWVELKDKKSSLLVLDATHKKIYLKSELLSLPRVNYVEYPDSEGYNRDIAAFIKSFESGSEEDFTNPRVD